MIQLDIRTMLISQTLLGILTVFLMLLLWQGVKKDIRGVGMWTLAFAFSMGGYSLIALRGVIPYVLTMVPGNLLVIMGMLALLYGAGAFLNVKISRTYAFLTLALISVSFTIFGHLFPIVWARVAILNAVFVVTFVSCAYLFYRHAEKPIAPNARAVAVALLFMALIAALRIYGAFAFPLNKDWLHPSPWEAWGLLAMTIAQTAIAFTLIELVDARVRAQVVKIAEEKTLLIREMHHRTKNDFAIVESLISLETAEPSRSDTVEVLERIKDRVHSFALLHDRLYRGKGSGTVEVGEYLSLIAAGLMEGATTDGRIVLRKKVQEAIASPGSAVSLGLIVNELITNALKHAFPGGRSGAIDLVLIVEGKNARLEVADDGIGLAESVAATGTGGLGMTLVSSLVAQIGGTIERSSKPGEGVRTSLTFTLPQPV